MGVEIAINVKVIKAVNKVAHRHQQEELEQEELGQEEVRDQEEQDHLHQEEDMEEAAQRQAAPHRSRQEEQAIQEIIHLPLQVYHKLIVLQIHGVHLIDPGSLFQS